MGSWGEAPIRISGDKFTGFLKEGLHGKCAECEPIMGAWVLSPHRGAEAEPLVRGSKLKAF